MIGQYGEPNESQPIPMTAPVAALRERLALIDQHHPLVNARMIVLAPDDVRALLRRLDRAEAVVDLAHRATTIAEWWAVPQRLREELAEKVRDYYRAEGEEVGG